MGKIKFLSGKNKCQSKTEERGTALYWNRDFVSSSHIIVDVCKDLGLHLLKSKYTFWNTGIIIVFLKNDGKQKKKGQVYL